MTKKCIGPASMLQSASTIISSRLLCGTLGRFGVPFPDKLDTLRAWPQNCHTSKDLLVPRRDFWKKNPCCGSQTSNASL